MNSLDSNNISYGIINIRVSKKKAKRLISKYSTSTMKDKYNCITTTKLNCIMMVSRKHSIGFIEFVRGLYDLNNEDSIGHLIEQMYPSEIENLKYKDYNYLMSLFTGRSHSYNDYSNNISTIITRNIITGRYSNIYNDNINKFNKLVNHNVYNLDYYLNNYKPLYSGVEWGFPKGRKSYFNEDGLTCACREFMEETGYSRNDFIVLNKHEPLVENMIGTNNVKYQHVYYIAIDNCNSENMKLDEVEVGDAQFFSIDNAINIIRPYHKEKLIVVDQIKQLMK